MSDPTLFDTYRAYLFAIAYRMLGSVMDAEDMVQEAYLRWQKASPVQIESPKSWLATIITRLCLDFLRSARVQRESYVGPWLPEPLPTSAASEETAVSTEGAIILSESISIAFLVLLENLSPTERAVYLLREVFDYGYADIARMVNKSEAACRQLVRRAKQHLQTHRPRYAASAEASQQLTAEFFQACTDGDAAKLFSLLAEDVVEWSDGGGKVHAARKPIIGRDKVARFMLGLARQAPPGIVPQFTVFNGQPGVIIYVDGRPFTVIVLEIVNNQIQNIYSVVNPDKLRHIPDLNSA
ncbi:RNA polymerase sigma-70 factor [Candidatus Leptofilum sp.]|uniref:RNA polymerase sigma-70 factor n=1 Tax=Candidatus Leptofilum sp. TaxID=3241576 RepID=UPI003B5ACA02